MASNLKSEIYDKKKKAKKEDVVRKFETTKTEAITQITEDPRRMKMFSVIP